MKTEEQIRADVVNQIVDSTKNQLNEEMTQLEKDLEEAYKTKIEKEVEYAMQSAETGYISTSTKNVDSENRKFQEELVNLRVEKEKIEKKLKAIEQFK